MNIAEDDPATALRWIISEDRRSSCTYATMEVDPSEKDTFYLMDDRPGPRFERFGAR